MLSLNQRTRNYTVLFITSLGIIGLVLYYLIIYIPENEQRINGRNFRVLQRIGANLTKSIDDYVDKIAPGYGKTVLEDLLDKKLIQQGAGGAIKVKTETIYKLLDERAGNKLIEDRDNGLSYSPVHGEVQPYTHILKKPGGTYLHFASIIVYDKKEEDYLDFKFDTSFYFHSRIRLDSLLIPLMRWDCFDYFVIFRKKGKAPNQTAEVIFNGAKTNQNKKPIDLLPPDSLLAMANKTAGNAPVEVVLAGESYKLFLLNKQVSPDENWVFCSAVPAGRYETERRAIPAHIVTFACLVFAFLLFSLPFLKLLLISKRERLNKADVVYSGLSVFVGVAMLVILLIDGYQYYITDSDAEEKRLEKLGKEIEHNLTRELGATITHLKTLDTFPDPRPVVADLKKDGKLSRFFSPQARTGQARQFLSPHVVRVFWLDSAGRMITNWTTNKRPDRKYNVYSRSYFRNVKNEGQGWTLPNAPQPFALESVSSMIDGRKYAVISTQSSRPQPGTKPTARVVALTTKLASLYNPILPPGYGFCVIDKEGSVLFHQQENLNLNENLLEETNSPPELKAALYSRVSSYFEINYQGSKQRLYIAPIQHLPVFLVTYMNFDFQKMANVHLIMVTVMMLTLYFVILGLFLVLVVYVRSRPAKLHLYWFAFKWLWPKSCYARFYLKTSLFLAGTILLVLWLADPQRPVTAFFMLLYAATYNFVACYIRLHGIPIFSVLTSRLFFFSLGSAAILLVLNICSLVTGTDTFVLGLLFQVLLLCFFFGITHLYHHYGPSSDALTYGYRPLYNGMLLCWLLLTSALPAFIFFRIAYNYEMELTLRHNQLHLAQKLSSQPSQVGWSPGIPAGQNPAGFVYAKFLYNTRPAGDPAHLSGRKTAALTAQGPSLLEKEGSASLSDAFWLWMQAPFLKAGRNLDSVQDRATQNESWQANEFVMLVRPKFRNVLANAFFLKANCKPGTDCHPNHWQIKDSLLHFTYTSELNQDHTTEITSRLPRYHLPGVVKAGTSWPANIHNPGWIFWVDALLLVLFVYFLISFLVQRIFSLGLHWNNPLNKIDKDYLNPEVKNKLLVISLSIAPDIKEFIRQQRQPGGAPFRLVQLDLAKTDFESDLIPLPNNSAKPPVVLLIKNFDFDPYSAVALKYKVALLQKLNAMPRLKIIIQSSLHPACWQEKLAREEEQEEKEKGAQGRATYIAVLEQLLMHLSAYIKLYQPLQSQVRSAPAGYKYRMTTKEYLERLIHQECSSCSYLHQFEASLVEYVEDCCAQKRKISKDDIIFLLQERAQLFYRYIWTSCSEEEQYFLYDLAQDGLANARNIQVLSALLGKGLIVQVDETALKIMNASFRNFVLTVVDPAEALRYEKITAQSSKWDMYKTPLMLIFIAGALFIFFTQKQTWLNIAAVLAAFSTIMGILPRLGVLLPAIFAGKEAKAAG